MNGIMRQDTKKNHNRWNEMSSTKQQQQKKPIESKSEKKDKKCTHIESNSIGTIK